MSGKSESDDGFGVWRTVIIVVAAVITVGTLLPVLPSYAKKGVLTDNLNNAKQVVIGLRMFAGDNEDQFPRSLEELVPKYCPTREVLFNTVADSKTKAPWQYFSGHKFDEAPPVVVIRSSPNSKGDWVAGYSDGSARIIYKADEESRK